VTFARADCRRDSTNPVTGSLRASDSERRISGHNHGFNQFWRDSKASRLTIVPRAVIDSPLTATGTENAPGFTYTITANNGPVSFGVRTSVRSDIQSEHRGHPGSRLMADERHRDQRANAYAPARHLGNQRDLRRAARLAIVNVTNTYSSPYC